MSALKFPVPIPPPRRAERTLLPAALSALLALLLAVQLALPWSSELPDAGVGRPLRLEPLPVVTPRADPEIARRPLFAPNRRETPVAGTGDTSAALGGARVVGVVARRGAALVFIQAPDGRVSRVGIGQFHDGWRIVRANSAGVTVARGTERAVVPIGASAPPAQPRPATSEDPVEEEEQQ